MEDLKFKWNASVATNQWATEEKDTLVIDGELVNAEVCSNNFAIEETEFPSIVKQLPETTLRVDHSASARDVIGGFVKGEHDEKNKRILFRGEVDDKQIQRLIVKGRLKYVSIGATADAFCSECGKPTRPVKACTCEGAYDIIRNIRLKEASIITNPAYPSSQFKPVGFFAGIDSALTESLKVTEPSSKEEDDSEHKSEKVEEKGREMSEETETKATVINPDVILTLTKKLEEVSTRLESIEKGIKEAKTKEEEERRKADAEKKEEELITKAVETTLKKLEEVFTLQKEKEEEKEEEETKEETKEETAAQEEEEEEEEKKKEEPVTRGAKVEKPEETEVTGSEEPKWWDEIVAAAKEYKIIP